MTAKDEVVLTLTEDPNGDNSPIMGPFNATSRRIALLGHFSFRLTALLTYLFCAWFTTSFITPFVLILICLAFDFWFVKNISGRVLAGLRWDSFINNSTGQTEWRFDSRDSSSNQSIGQDHTTLTRREVAALASHANQARLFWVALIVFPSIWAILLLAAVFSLSLRWALLSTISLGMTGTNLYAFVRCRLRSSSSSASSSLLTGLQLNTVRQLVKQAWTSTSTKPSGTTVSSATINA